MHSKFPWTRHPHTPTAVFDADGKRIVDQWVAPDGWLPVETAPVKALTDDLPSYYRFKCLLLERGEVFQGYAQYTHKKKILVWKNAALYDRSCTPTHWQPLPAPPSDKPAPTPLDPETAVDNAALIAAIPRMVEALNLARKSILTGFSTVEAVTAIDAALSFS